MPSLSESLHAKSHTIVLPKGGEGDVIGIEAITDIAREYGVAGHTVEAEALRHNIIPTRYLRNMDSIPAADQIKLLESSIAQVGLGGLGGNLLEMFLRTGVGTIRGADGDSFEESNLNRQALSTPANLNIPKAEAAARRADEINPSVSFRGQDAFLTKDSLPSFVEKTDLVVDALGGLEMRLALQHAAAEAKIPMVTGALAGWTGYVGVVLPGQIGPADIMGNDNGAEEKLGCPAPAVTFMASLMVTEAIKILTGQKSNLEATMLIIDLKTLTFEKISL